MEQKIFSQKELDEIEDAVIKAQHGDVAGFEYLYEFARNNCRYAAYSHINNKNDADDAFQTAFLKVYENIGSIKNPRTFISYINTVINHTCYDMNKKHDNSRVDTFTDKEYEDGPEFLDTFVDESDYAKVDVNIEHEERQKLIEEIMSDLSDEQKACVFAYYIQEISIKDIAAEYNVSENTIKSRLFQSRKKMEAKGNELKKRGIEFFGLTIVGFLASLSSMEAKACEYTVPAFNTTMAHITATKTVATNTAASTGAKTAAKSSIKIMGKTISTKIAALGTAAIVGAGVIGAGVVLSNNNKNTSLYIDNSVDTKQYIYTDFDKDNNYIELAIDKELTNNAYWVTFKDENLDSEIHSLVSHNENDIHIYAKMYEDVIYLTTGPTTDTNNESLFVLWANDSENNCSSYYNYDENTILVWPTEPIDKVASVIYNTNFDFSKWVDITELGTQNISQNDAYNYSIEHQEEWCELITKTNEPIPDINISNFPSNINSHRVNNDQPLDANDESNSLNNESSPFSGSWTNDFPGAFEGVTAFAIDFTDMTYSLGDTYGDIIYIGNNQYNLILKGYSDGTINESNEIYDTITVVDNNDGTLSINSDIFKEVGTFSW